MIQNTMSAEAVDDLNTRVLAALDLQRRINLATGLTACSVEVTPPEPDVVAFELKAIDGFVIATVKASWQPPRPINPPRYTKGYWRLGTVRYFDLNDLKAAIDET